jgi:hypothetical protein
MRIESGIDCVDCGAEVIIYTAKDTPAKCLNRTLPAWKRCRCGWLEICMSTLESYVPNWRKHLKSDEE